MSESTPTSPALPDPAGSICPENGTEYVDAFTADQMRAYAAAQVAQERASHERAMAAALAHAQMETGEERPYWFPTLTDDAWIARVRADYPLETEGMSDEWVRDTYADGYKYADTWDHLGDARNDYEKLADAYLALLERGRLDAANPTPTT